MEKPLIRWLLLTINLTITYDQSRHKLKFTENKTKTEFLSAKSQKDKNHRMNNIAL